IGDLSVTKTDGTSTGTDSAASATEIAAAFLTGNVPTSDTSGYSYSGGVENYMRFAENWSSVNLRYRGSIVALFNSKVALGQWKNAKYSPPTRQWGYDNEFTKSTGGYPPGTPYLRTLRRIDYQDLSSTEFNADLADANYNFVKMQ
ncbi:MAG: hypothetical protein KGJ37_04820, partial [Verrucomicrobiota bacterium]|nr:hypothetical protein [Verrucomicrobiota bacterium]